MRQIAYSKQSFVINTFKIFFWSNGRYGVIKIHDLLPILCTLSECVTAIIYKWKHNNGVAFRPPFKLIYLRFFVYSTEIPYTVIHNKSIELHHSIWKTISKFWGTEWKNSKTKSSKTSLQTIEVTSPWTLTVMFVYVRSFFFHF